MNKTKKSLLFSGLALMMSALLLVGTTFAWFTDSVTNKGNVITSGNLSIEAVAYDVDTAKDTYTIPGVNNGNAFGFKDQGTNLKGENVPAIINEKLWEPGVSNAKLLTVTNTGSLATNVQVKFDVKDGGLMNALWFDFINVENGQFTKRPMSQLAALGDATTVTLEAKESVSFILVYGMNEEAGNEYQGKDFSADVKIIATQAPVEEDGFGNPNYDEDANIADFEAKDTAELENALSQAKAGDTIALTNDIALDKPLTIKQDVTIDGMGATISGQPITATADVTFKNVTLSKPTNTGKNATLVYGYTGCETLTFEGCTFADPQWEAIQVTSADFKKLVVNNCTFTAANVEGAESSYGNAADEAIRYIHIQPKASDKVVADITITNNTFKNCDKVKDSVVGIYFVDGSTITVGGNTFENLTDEDTSAKLSVGWPEEEELKTVSNWTGEPKTFPIG